MLKFFSEMAPGFWSNCKSATRDMWLELDSHMFEHCLKQNPGI